MKSSMFHRGLLVLVLLSASVLAASPATETYLASVGDDPRSDVWITNVSASPVTFTFQFLQSEQENATPAFFEDTLAAGETRMYADVVSTRLHLTNVSGAARILSDGELFVAARSQGGLFSAGLPKSYSIALGQSASIESRDAYLIETSGAAPGVHLEAFDDQGSRLGSTDIALEPYEQVSLAADSISPAGSGVIRLVATVTSGLGTVLLAGKQAAIVPTAKPGFEQVLDKLLSSGGTAGVTSLNSLTGAVSLIAGSNVTLSPVGNGIKIDTSGSGGGVPNVNGITGAVTIAHGANTTLNVAGSTITIDAVAGSGTGLTAVAHDNTLAGSGTTGAPLGMTVPLALSGTSGDTISGAYTSSSGSNAGVFGSSASGSGFGVHGHSSNKNTDGYLGGNDYGVFGIATDSAGNGVQGHGGFKNTDGYLGGNDYGVRGIATDGVGNGVRGESNAGGTNTACGVYGVNSNAAGAGVGGLNNSNGNLGALGGPYYGVVGVSNLSTGVFGSNTGSTAGGVKGTTSFSGGCGVVGSNTGASGGTYGYLGCKTDGIQGHTDTAGGSGVSGFDNATSGNTSAGVYGVSSGLYGVWGVGSLAGVRGDGVNGGLGGRFFGDVLVNGNVNKSGGSFKIDHPLDPAHKYLYHSFVESPDMKNVYDGITTLSASGTATVALPDWFGVLNRDFRYQLTALGTPQAGLFVSREVANNEFTIAGGVPGARVSWQVTGIRQDAWANAHRIPLELVKPDSEQDTYLHPELFGEPMTKSFDAVTRERAMAESAAAGNE